ncbi:MAG: TonB-dependent receptor [Gammaproteobacteria bacterium]|jgi:iron complex outermembrane receptor protein|nr:TonB-dependent receptor [Gammaproteobacteria bacterium]MBT6653774.1 TonB-dependent receptor [Gammaproteobacteria bacterium]MBT6880744.1 TonB-dependent receptor [Gammaproteobacteria bacterium]HIJ27380.1 TonB-dependent receptor [Gammaproteobacteria bacterium]HIJ30216.1 TonB-dependent receptor [Gammaproteobacteria bacterium]
MVVMIVLLWGGVISHEISEGVDLSLNLSAKKSGGAEHDSGEYFVGDNLIGQAGSLNTKREFFNSFINLSIDETLIEIHYMKNGKGGHFGISDLLPSNSGEIVLTDELLKVDLTHPFLISERLSAEVQIDYSYGGFDMDDIQVLGGGSFHRGNVEYREERYDGNLEFVWEGFESNRLLVGVHFADVSAVNSDQLVNYDPNTFADLGTYQTYALIESASRTISSLYLQDQYEISDRLMMTVGGRLDHYSDMGNSTTPSISALYELDEENILKAQYAEAFRPPSFNELYTTNNPVVTGNLGLEGETISTTEISHIHKEAERSLRSTLFYSEFKNLIHKDTTTKQYENSGAGWHRGIELEAEQVINSDWKVDGNLSWIETEDEEKSHDLEGAPDWLANLNLTWQPRSGQTVTAHLRHVGERNRDSADTRSELDGFQTLDLTGSWKKIYSTDLNLRAGVRNLLDDAVVYPAAAGTYAADYPQQGRTWWLRLSRTF